MGFFEEAANRVGKGIARLTGRASRSLVLAAGILMSLCFASCSSMESDARKLAEKHFELQMIGRNVGDRSNMYTGKEETVRDFEAKLMQKYSKHPETKEKFLIILDAEFKRLGVTRTIDVASNYDNDDSRQNTLIGKVFRNSSEISELKNMDYWGGSMVSDRFDIEYLADGNHLVFIFSEIVRYEGNSAIFKIVDAIKTENIITDESFILLSDCRKNKVSDSEIIAIGIYENKDFLNKIVKAWRINTKTRKIEPIDDLRGIDCENVDGGGEY